MVSRTRGRTRPSGTGACRSDGRRAIRVGSMLGRRGARTLAGRRRERVELRLEGHHRPLDLAADLEQRLADDETIEQQLGGVVAGAVAVGRAAGSERARSSSRPTSARRCWAALSRAFSSRRSTSSAWTESSGSPAPCRPSSSSVPATRRKRRRPRGVSSALIPSPTLKVTCCCGDFAFASWPWRRAGSRAARAACARSARGSARRRCPSWP